jgi:hypothetical protein
LSHLLFVLPAGFGCVIALFGFALYRQAARARKWPVVAGTIHVSVLEPYRAPSSERSLRGPAIVPTQVSYSYSFNKMAFSNLYAKVVCCDPSRSNWVSRRLMPDYKEGERVWVHVDPQNPARTVVDPGGRMAWVLWLIAVGFWALSYYVAVP